MSPKMSQERNRVGFLYSNSRDLVNYWPKASEQHVSAVAIMEESRRRGKGIVQYLDILTEDGQRLRSELIGPKNAYRTFNNKLTGREEDLTPAWEFLQEYYRLLANARANIDRILDGPPPPDQPGDPEPEPKPTSTDVEQFRTLAELGAQLRDEFEESLARPGWDPTADASVRPLIAKVGTALLEQNPSEAAAADIKGPRQAWRNFMSIYKAKRPVRQAFEALGTFVIQMENASISIAERAR